MSKVCILSQNRSKHHFVVVHFVVFASMLSHVVSCLARACRLVFVPCCTCLCLVFVSRDRVVFANPCTHVLSNQLVGSSYLAGTCALPLLLTRACAYRPWHVTSACLLCTQVRQSGPNVRKCARHNCPYSLNLVVCIIFVISYCCCRVCACVPTYVLLLCIPVHACACTCMFLTNMVVCARALLRFWPTW